MLTVDEIIAEARSWIRTPTHHNAETKQAGCDCGGLIRGVGVATGAIDADYQTLPAVRAWLGYGRQADGRMDEACRLLLDPVDEPLRPGHVILMRISRMPTHMGIVADYVHGGLSLIHSWDDVMEHHLSERWQKRILSVYRFRNVDYGE